MSEVAARVARSPDVPPGMIARIVEVLHPKEVWLFGSRARGEARQDSDWDFMAIDLELDAAKRRIADPPNRFATFHLEQAAEKLRDCRP